MLEFPVLPSAIYRSVSFSRLAFGLGCSMAGTLSHARSCIMLATTTIIRLDAS